MTTQLTTQEHFDKIVRHLLTQKRRAVAEPYAEYYTCRYREFREDGANLKCAIGCLIPDEDYDPRMEGMDVACLWRHFPKLQPLLAPGEDLIGPWNDPWFSLNARLQRIHDLNMIEDWETRLRDLAREFGLTFPNLEVAA